jgi:hypothetical protein
MTTEPTDPRTATEPAPARDKWDTDVPGDATAEPETATLPDQVGDDYALRETTSAEERSDYQATPLPQDGDSFARTEESDAADAPRTEPSGRPEQQDGEGYARQEVVE